MGHVAKDWRRKGKGEGQGMGKTMKDAGRRAQANLEDTRETFGRNPKLGIHKKNSAGRVVESGTSPQSVDGGVAGVQKEDADCREVKDNLSQRRMEMSEEWERWECGGTRGRGRRHGPPMVPIQVLGT